MIHLSTELGYLSELFFLIINSGSQGMSINLSNISITVLEFGYHDASSSGHIWPSMPPSLFLVDSAMIYTTVVIHPTIPTLS